MSSSPPSAAGGGRGRSTSGKTRQSDSATPKETPSRSSQEIKDRKKGDRDEDPAVSLNSLMCGVAGPSAADGSFINDISGILPHTASFSWWGTNGAEVTGEPQTQNRTSRDSSPKRETTGLGSVNANDDLESHRRFSVSNAASDQDDDVIFANEPIVDTPTSYPKQEKNEEPLYEEDSAFCFRMPKINTEEIKAKIVEVAMPESASGIVDKRDLTKSGLGISFTLFYQACFLATFFALFATAYVSQLSSKFLSPIGSQNKGTVCEEIPIMINARYRMDIYGNWEGSANFQVLPDWSCTLCLCICTLYYAPYVHR
jgi:hypothetical protein